MCCQDIASVAWYKVSKECLLKVGVASSEGVIGLLTDRDEER